MKLDHLFANNRAWAAHMSGQNGEFFQKLSKQQTPQYLWIGCSDSRVPANEIVGLLPGELFVHRNIANLVVSGDLNCVSVIEFAVAILHVDHIIVCGHYGCSGVQAVVDQRDLGTVSKWLHHLNDVNNKYSSFLEAIPGPEERVRKLCELNVIEQVRNVCQLAAVQRAWADHKNLAVHGWVYSLEDGLLKDLLENPVTSPANFP